MVRLRYLLLAGVLFVGCSASPPEEHSKPSQQRRSDDIQDRHATSIARSGRGFAVKEQTTRRKPEENVDRSEQHSPCSKPADHNKCELEAEWKSADSASDAAYWAKLQAIFSGVGVVGLIATLYFAAQTARAALAAGRDSSESLRIARGNADAASNQVEIAKASSERQLRAYVGIDSIKVRSAGDGFYTAEIIVKNYGLTPGYGCAISTACRVDQFPLLDPHEKEPLPDQQTHTLTLFPTGTVPAYAGCAVSDHIRDIENGDAAFYVYGHIIYRDHDNHDRLTQFAYRGTEMTFFRNGEVHVCLGGNTAN